MPVDRRRFLAACSSVGLGSTLFPGVLLAALAADEKITPEMIDSAAAIAGVPVAPDQRAALLNTLTQNRKSYETLSALKMPNSVPPAFLFDPLPPGQRPTPPPAGVDGRKALRLSPAPATAGREVPADLNILAFATVRELGELVRRKKISAVN